jgi:AcrR family transcriptional regulator
LSRKQHIVDTAARLFADQGFDGTTTVQLVAAAGVTEPALYYHFKGKHDLYFQIIETTFADYFSRLNALQTDTATQFEKIENLIALHFEFVEEVPAEIYLTVSTCPAKLKDPKHVCTKNITRQRKWLTSYLSDCLKAGVKAGEFHSISVPHTVSLFIALINGLLRQRGLQLEHLAGLKDEAVAFCRRSLVKQADKTEQR